MKMTEEKEESGATSSSHRNACTGNEHSFPRRLHHRRTLFTELYAKRRIRRPHSDRCTREPAVTVRRRRRTLRDTMGKEPMHQSHHRSDPPDLADLSDLAEQARLLRAALERVRNELAVAAAAEEALVLKLKELG